MSTTPNLPAVIPPKQAATPRQQLGDLPIEELRSIAEEFGISPKRTDDKATLIAAIHERRQRIASLERAALVDVLEWAHRPIVPGASLEQMAMEILHLRSMRFNGLSDRGLFALAQLRGCQLEGVTSRDDVVRLLKAQEGFFAKMGRKTRGWVGKRLERMMGDSTTAPPADSGAPVGSATVTDAPNAPRQQPLKEEIESSGLFGGIANRVKRQADSYVNQKLDEIEARIDRKLDEIDRRLAEWRDKEIANRIRILKITLWVSVIVAVISLIYSYIQVQARHWNDPSPTAHVAPQSPPKP